jgi:hypothetical protein
VLYLPHGLAGLWRNSGASSRRPGVPRRQA